MQMWKVSFTSESCKKNKTRSTKIVGEQKNIEWGAKSDPTSSVLIRWWKITEPIIKRAMSKVLWMEESTDS
jgi:hypothetical protein